MANLLRIGVIYGIVTNTVQYITSEYVYDFHL